MTQNKKWDRIESFGPKIVENIVQAISRDILAYAMNTLKDYCIVGHVHDEVIIEAPTDADVKIICQKMSQTPPWIPGLLLRADGYETEWYKNPEFRISCKTHTHIRPPGGGGLPPRRAFLTFGRRCPPPASPAGRR